MKAKRVVVISDLHDGSKFSACVHPKWQTDSDERIKELQSKGWNWYSKTIKSLYPIDVLIVNGDAIDGNGVKNGGIELITTDRAIQCDMAFAAIMEARAQKIVMTIGTPYHCGNFEDWERQLAKQLDCQIDIVGKYVINGVRFNVRHFLATGRLPYTATTGISKEALFDMHKAAYYEDETADIIIRSHVHKSHIGDGILPKQIVIITPSLQMLGCGYAERKCSGVVDVGLVVIDIDEKGNPSCKKILMPIHSLIQPWKTL